MRFPRRPHPISKAFAGSCCHHKLHGDSPLLACPVLTHSGKAKLITAQSASKRHGCIPCVAAYSRLGFFKSAILMRPDHRFQRAPGPQKMMIMNLVWPISALYFGPVALWAYLKSGPTMTTQAHETVMQDETRSDTTLPQSDDPTPEQVFVATTHCGAGCTLGDIAGEGWIYGAGILLAGGELGTRLLLDFLLAWAFGVIFQYFTIAPMRGLSLGKGLRQADARGYLVHRGISNRDVSLGSLGILRVFSRSSSSNQRGSVLVHDANRHDRRIFHVVSRQPLFDQVRVERKDADHG